MGLILTIIRNLKINFLFGSLIILSCLGDSCSSKHTYYSDFIDIPKSGWLANEPITFDIADSLNYDGLNVLTIRHDNFYNYRNLWLFIDYIAINKEIKRDTLELKLADIYGNWYGNGFGSTYEFNIYLKPLFKANQLKRIVVWQAMRDDTLSNIINIGLAKVEK
ncbi:MAG: gliding motility lipoprotein GldH [Muribaculaceae bacterium]|nr:gliding motility lipoprotein GldH [Muribaculaceae bacterium]